MNSPILSVSAVNQYIKNMLDKDIILRNLFIEGEISNCKIHYSGHIYFTLKDQSSLLKSVMFRTDAAKLRFQPEDGMKVIVQGRISAYERDGVYQLYASSIEPQGKGALQLAFEQLKQKLAGEGLFEREFKKNLPTYPKRIGVVTSSTGAAIRDIIQVAARRNSSVELVIYPVLVQGSEAPGQIVRAIHYFNRVKNVDVLIIGRGGGSIEDLWAFNDENVARAIFGSVIPIVSAVGHETDFTIADFVADLRAPTPSAAAEMSVPNKEELQRKLRYLHNSLFSKLEYCIVEKKRDLQLIQQKLLKNSPSDLLKQQQLYHDYMYQKFVQTFNAFVMERKKTLTVTLTKLEAMNPLKVMLRGYGIVENNQKQIIQSVSDCKEKEQITVHLQDGKLKCTVDFIECEGEL